MILQRSVISQINSLSRHDVFGEKVKRKRKEAGEEACKEEEMQGSRKLAMKESNSGRKKDRIRKVVQEVECKREKSRRKGNKTGD